MLIADYFKNRQQVTKVNNSTSEPNKVILGVPQGSILGPLFFLIYINDLIYYINDASAKLFADDTTIYYSDDDIGNITFNTIIIELLAWCTHNRLDINWTKTFLMVVTNKLIKIPPSFTFNNIEIKCVEEFKLFGVTIDSKLNFNKHISIISHTINSKLFAIKNVFYLSTYNLSKFNSSKLFFFLTLTTAKHYLYMLGR